MITKGKYFAVLATHEREDADKLDYLLGVAGWWVGGVTSSDAGGGVYVTVFSPDVLAGGRGL